MTTYRPFANGSQFADWESCNCSRCEKSQRDPEQPFICDLQERFFEAEIGDGRVSEDTARRIGFIEHKGSYVWCCNEVVWTGAWKDALARKRGYADAAAYLAAIGR